MQVLLQLLLLALGFVMLVKGADWFVDGAAEAANRLGISQIIVGLTIVAMGTSAPEAAISISSALKGSADIAVGNVVGSNIMNILLILGVTAVITPLAVQRATRKFEIPFVIIISFVMVALGLFDGVIGKIDGIILIILFAVYFVYLYMSGKKKEKGIELELNDPNDPTGDEKTEHALEKVKEIEKNSIKRMSKVKIVIFIAVGIVLIILGSNIAVGAASELARIVGIPERIIALTIVAFGTSLPELCTCIVAGLKKNADIAIGNIIGSNIFNILFVLGISALVTDIPYQRGFLVDSIVCIATPVLLWILLFNKDIKLKRYGGIILLIAYAAYFAYTLVYMK